MPDDRSPVVLILAAGPTTAVRQSELVLTQTSPPAPPEPPGPPIAKLTKSPAPSAKPPLPPPPPMLCAKMADDSRPIVVRLPLFDTVTVLPSPPAAPLPPMPTDPRPSAPPPLPPPPPIDWAKMALVPTQSAALKQWLVMLPEFSTQTVPALLPPPPRPPIETSPPAVPPLPPVPPMLCAKMPAAKIEPDELLKSPEP